MSANLPRQSHVKLHSPLLNRVNKILDENSNKGKRTYYNPKEDHIQNNNIDSTLDSVLFNNKENLILFSGQNSINCNSIDILETCFKIASIFILATGGILSLLEFINIARTLYMGSFDFGNSHIVFAASLITTIIANIICLGFIHLIKTTKYLYLNLENQNSKIEKLIYILTRGN